MQMTNICSTVKAICALFLTCILVFMFQKDKFSLAPVQVVHLGEVRNVEMIIQEMTGKTRKVKMEKRNIFDLYVTSGGSCLPRKKLQGSSSRRINE